MQKIFRYIFLVLITFSLTACTKALLITTAVVLIAPSAIIQTFNTFETRAVDVSTRHAVSYLANREYQTQKNLWIVESSYDKGMMVVDEMSDFLKESLAKRNSPIIEIKKGTCFYVNTVLAPENAYTTRYEELKMFACYRDENDVPHTHINVTALFAKDLSDSKGGYIPIPTLIKETPLQ